jgi:hypothetical protein
MRALIGFGEEGEMLGAAALTAERLHSLGLALCPLRFAPSERQRAFLRYHREHVFRGNLDVN